MNNKAVLFFLFIACLFSLVQSTVAQKQNKQIDEVLQTLKKYDDAWNKKDLATVGKILAAEYIYFTSIGGLSTRRQTLDFLNSPSYKLTFVERSEIKSYRTGDTVVISSRWKGRGSWEKGEINDDQRCGQVFVKNGKRWILASEHCVQIVSR